MNKDLAKSLTELIDETLAELEDLRKSRFEAEEIDMGHDANGEMKKEEDKKEEKEESKEDEKKEEKAEKAEDKKEDEKKEDKKEDSDEDDMKKAEEEYQSAMKKRDQLAEKIKMKKGVNNEAEMKKTAEPQPEVKSDRSEIEALKKSFEDKISEISAAVKKLADQPVPAKGATYKDVQPLAKGAADAEPLNKSKVLSDLVELKKSGKTVATEDVLRAELGGQGDLQEIANKYSIK